MGGCGSVWGERGVSSCHLCLGAWLSASRWLLVTLVCLGVYLAWGLTWIAPGCWRDSVYPPVDTSGPLAWTSALGAAFSGPSPPIPPTCRTSRLQRSRLQAAERLPKQTSPRDL